MNPIVKAMAERKVAEVDALLGGLDAMLAQRQDHEARKKLAELRSKIDSIKRQLLG